MDKPWFGFVAEDVNNEGDLMSVIIPDFDPKLRWNDVRWHSRGSDPQDPMPRKGDHVLLMFDNARRLWAIGWWPYV